MSYVSEENLSTLLQTENSFGDQCYDFFPNKFKL